MADSQNEESKESVLLFCLKENCEHMRHVEAERLQFTSIFAGIVAGSFVFLKEIMSSNQKGLLLIFLCGVSYLGLLLSFKWGYTFERHRAAVNNIMAALSADGIKASGYIIIHSYGASPKPGPDGTEDKGKANRATWVLAALLSTLIKIITRPCKTNTLFNLFYFFALVLFLFLLFTPASTGFTGGW